MHLWQLAFLFVLLTAFFSTHAQEGIWEDSLPLGGLCSTEGFTLTGDLKFNDEVKATFGTDDDWDFYYNEAGNDQLIISTDNHSSSGFDDPLLHILFDADTADGTNLNANQTVLKISKGTPSDFTNLFWLTASGELWVSLLGVLGTGGDPVVFDMITDHTWSPSTEDLQLGDSNEGIIKLGLGYSGIADDTISTFVYDDIFVSKLNFADSAEDIDFLWQASDGTPRPIFALVEPVADRGNYLGKSLLIGPWSAAVSDVDENVICSTNFSNIDCDPTSGADLGVKDDAEIGDDLFVGDDVTVTGSFIGGITVADTGIDVQDGAGNSALISYDANSFNIDTHLLRSIFIGKDAGGSGSQLNNIAIGGLSGDALDAGQRNTFLGAYSGSATINGHNNTCLGYGACDANSGGTSNTVIGRNAGGWAGAAYTNATMVGDSAGNKLTSGTNNLFFGYNAGTDVTTGHNNTLFGTGGANIVSGDDNVAIGNLAINSVTTQNSNVAFGGAGGRYIVGKENVFIGVSSGRGTNDANVDDYNVVIGQGAGLLMDGSDNVFIGHDAGARQVTIDNKLIIDNDDRGSIAAELTDALIVGDFHPTDPAQQTLLFNADVVSNTYNYAPDTAGGATDAYEVDLNPVPNSYREGMIITFKADLENTGACTVDVNGLGAKDLKMLHNQVPADNYIEDGSMVMAVYDGTNFQMIQPNANP